MGRQAALVRALVLAHRYTIDISEIARRELAGGSSNRHVEVLIRLGGSGGMTSSQLAEALGASRAATSRVVSVLVAEGLVERRVNAADGRSVRLVLARRGTARFRRFERSLANYMHEAAPVVKDILDGLGVEHAGRSGSVPALQAIFGVASVGARYVEEVEPALARFGISASVDRFAIALLGEFGQLRPGQLADELHLSASAVSDLAGRLETAGLTVRRYLAVAGDRRAVVVELTPLGLDALGVLLATFEAHSADVCEALALTL